jgi:HK97 family phage portal protein
MPVVIRKATAPKGLNTQVTQSYYDAFRRKYTPTGHTLVREYKRVAFACANLNAAAVCDTPLKLYVKSGKSDKPTILETKAISNKKIDYLSNVPYLEKTLRSFVNIEEVVTHPALNVLEKANSSRHLNGQRLFELSQLYQDITGKTYWLIERDMFGLPENIWILPSQFVTPQKTDTRTRKIVDYYEYSPPGIAEPKKYKPEDIIVFLMPSLMNPYVEGYGCLQAAFEANEVNNKLLSHEDALLENEGRPDAIISPKNTENAFSPDTARRYEREWKFKFTRGRSGGVWVPDDPVDFTPVTFPPRDIARFEIGKWSKNDLANAFSVPYALIADASHNRQQLEAAAMQHAKYATKPRCNRNAAVLNDLFISDYDDSGRLFLAYDDPVPETKEEKLNENIQLGMNGFKTPNEVRLEYNLPPHPDGNDLRPINVSPDMMRENTRESGGDKSEQGKGEDD